MPPKVALVVGAGRGIGLNIARRLAQDGMNVFIGDKDGVRLSAAINALAAQGIAVHPVVEDLAVESGSQNMIDKVITAAGQIDALVISIRAGQHRSMTDEDEDNWDLTQAIMLKAPYFLSQRAIYHMIKRESGGTIVHIGSIAGDLVTPKLSPSYHAAKAGLRQMTRYLAVMAGPHKIRVNNVVPGFIVQDEHKDRFSADGNKDYRDNAHNAHPLGRVGSSDDIAEAVSFLCSPASSFVTGTEICVDGGLPLKEQWSLIDPAS
jgi:NAD(P)-dependent dehydrogenase (short-subunit alcohol dehydrogenase family)